jgi:Tol biopolymer transport system component
VPGVVGQTIDFCRLPFLMRRIGLQVCVLALAASGGGKHPYASDQPITEPKLFEEGVISTPFDEFGLAFTRDGRTVLFNRSVPRSNLYAILTSTYRNGRWSEPEVAPFSGQYWDFDAVFSPDGSKVFFGSDRPVPGHPKKDQDFDIWMVEKTPRGWSEPTHLDSAINSDEDETFASPAANGTLYFVSGREGGRQNLAIYRSKLVDGKYAPAEKLKGPVNDKENWSLEVQVAPDESFLLLVPIGRKDGYGSFDIYISEQHDGEWTAPRNLGPKVNTSARDYSPRFSPDGKYLFWSSERGISSTRPEKPVTYQELEKGMHGILNGWGNIYQIELSAIGLGVKQ